MTSAFDGPCCLVLSGGGAKGVYHIGAWRALRELGVEVDAFVGASIGAIIAGFLAQGDDAPLEELGRSITVDSILALPEEFTEDGELRLDRESLAGVRELFRRVMDRKGLDTSPLRKILAGSLDEARIRASGRDLGIVTVNVSDLEPRELFLEEMEAGSLVDWLMASAAFPGFERPVIAGKKYIDGGIHDNIPYDMARKRGYRRIIVSDISGAGRNRKPDIAGSITVYIRNSVDMGGVLDFDRRFLDRFNLLGWLDTMRAFGRFEGYRYFLEPEGGASPEKEAGELPAAGAGLRPRLPERMRHERDSELAGLECAAAILEVDRVARYTRAGLREAIAKARAADEGRVDRLLSGGKLGKAALAAMIRDALASRSLDGTPYYYWRLVEEALQGTAESVLGKALVALYDDLPAGLEWLSRNPV